MTQQIMHTLEGLLTNEDFEHHHGLSDRERVLKLSRYVASCLGWKIELVPYTHSAAEWWVKRREQSPYYAFPVIERKTILVRADTVADAAAHEVGHLVTWWNKCKELGIDPSGEDTFNADGHWNGGTDGEFLLEVESCEVEAAILHLALRRDEKWYHLERHADLGLIIDASEEDCPAWGSGEPDEDEQCRDWRNSEMEDQWSGAVVGGLMWLGKAIYV